ncbi:MAG: glycosyltransferase family 2 protein [Balneola sp.]|nr:glycosyltransferase family 2 protein [Balneola sp.]MBO6650983.1 glycosyltransferase family 2 protein [Balneola sp.]MBO6711144.1 glycosyltransferase family 2 protein [Balneola sp.]MBO6800742.1 glycosyltransferase family 2 protein [Balneola sp.]MBO6869079.1 glycosyltransferase family 2 protein [Balneola sp.]
MFLDSSLFSNFVESFSDFVLIYFAIINGVYLTLVIISFFYLKLFNRQRIAYESKGLLRSELYKSVSIIVPAYNEEQNIIENVRSLMQVDFNDFEVIVSNDGSTDNTLQKLIDEYELEESGLYIHEMLPSKKIKKVYRSKIHDNLIVLDKENGKRADAVNAGINAAHKDLICTIDADSWLEQNVLRKMLRAFIEDDKTIGVGGIIRVSNGCTFENNTMKEIKLPDKLVPKIQVLEYIRSFLFGRIGWDKLNSLLIISGAFGVFDREAVLKVGGYDVESVGEDFELTLKLHRYHKEENIDYNIRFFPEPVCWTEVPSTWNDLSSQRNRWQRGLFETIVKHKKMLFNPKYGSVGLIGLPFYFIFELLSPVVEFLGYALIVFLMITGTLNSTFALLFFIAAVLLGVVLSLSAVFTDEFTYKQYPRVRDALLLIFLAIFENLGYRQLHTWWRLKGLVFYLRGNQSWDMKESGLWRKITEISHWTWLVVINIIIAILFWFGINGVGL